MAGTFGFDDDTDAGKSPVEDRRGGEEPATHDVDIPESERLLMPEASLELEPENISPLMEDEMVSSSVMDSPSLKQKKKGGSAIIVLIGGGFFMLLLLAGAGFLFMKNMKGSVRPVVQEESLTQEELHAPSVDSIPVVTPPPPVALSSDSAPVTSSVPLEAVVPEQSAPEVVSVNPKTGRENTLPPESAGGVPPQGSPQAAPVAPADIGVIEGRLRADISNINTRMDEVTKRIEALQKLVEASLSGKSKEPASISSKTAPVAISKPSEEIVGSEEKGKRVKVVAKHPVPVAQKAVVPSPKDKKDLPSAPWKPGMSESAALVASAPKSEPKNEVADLPVRAVEPVRATFVLTGAIGQRAWVLRRAPDGRETEMSVSPGDKIDGSTVTSVDDKERKVVLSNGTVISTGSARR